MVRSLVMVGNGMVGHRFLAGAIDRAFARQWTITVLAEERRLAYDRVNLRRSSPAHQPSSCRCSRAYLKRWTGSSESLSIVLFLLIGVSLLWRIWWCLDCAASPAPLDLAMAS